MKKIIMIVVMLALVTVCGCQSSSSRGGSVLRGEGFKIAVPTYDTEVKQGEVGIVTVSLERGDSFKQDVRLQVNTIKGGISVEPAKVLVKASDKPDVQLRITVPKDAALGEYSVSVTGTPETGEPTSTSFEVEVVSP
jgi:uncharacterized membrane protein